MSKFKTGLLVWVALMFSSLVNAQSIDEGRKLLYYEKYISAKAVFQKLVDANPANAEAAYWLGQTLIAPDLDKDVAGAKAVYQKALAASNNNPLLLAGMGHVELLEGKTQEARSHFETAISVSGGKNIAVLNAVGYANGDFFSTNGDPNYAIQVLKQATQVKGFKDPDVYVNLGDAYRKLADGGNALLSYNAALAIDPKYARAKYRIGRIYQTQGVSQKEIMMQYYNDAIALDPNYTPVYFTLFQYNYETNVPVSAQFLEKYLTAKGAADEPDACNLRSSILYAQGLFQQSIDKSKECIAAEGSNINPANYGRMAYAYNKLGDSNNAKLMFDEYFQKQKPAKLGPTDYITYSEVLLKFPGNEALAGTFVEKAVQLDTTEAGKAAVMKSIAQKLEAQKQYKEAAVWFKRIVDVKKVPGKLDLYYAGMNYNKAGEYQESINLFNKYIELYPNESFGYFMNGKNYAKLDSLDNGSNALNNYLKIVSMTDSIKGKPGEMDRIKGTLRYLIEYYANVRRDKDSAILFTDKGIALDPADADFVSIKEQLSKITNMKPVPRGTTPPAPAKSAPATTKPATTKPTGTAKPAPPKPTPPKKK